MPIPIYTYARIASYLLDHDNMIVHSTKNLVIERNARNLNRICSYVNGFN